MKLRALLALVLIVAASALLSGGAASGKACDLIPTLQAAQETVKDPVEDQTCLPPPATARIAGRVVNSFGVPAKNVRITANPPGNTIEQITGDEGEFKFTFDKPQNRGTVVLTAHPLADQKITPKRLSVKVRPGKVSFAKFEAEAGMVVGKVSEIICPAPVTRATCGHPGKRPGAIVEIRGAGVREEKFDETDRDGKYRFTVPPGKYEVRVFRLDVDGHADICQEDERLPVIVDSPSVDTKPAECAATLRRAGGRDNRREVVTVRAERKKETKPPVNFVAVPHRMVPVAEFATFDRGKRRRMTELTSGLVDPEKRRPTDPLLFGDYGSAGGDYDPVKKAIQCRTGCALVEVLVTNLLGEPLTGVDTNLSAFPVAPAVNAVGIENGGATNTKGDVCFIARDRAGYCATKGGKTDKAGRALGLYAAPGVVPGHSLPEKGADRTIRAEVRVDVPGQTLPRLGEYRDAVTAEPLRIRPNQRVAHTAARFTKRQLEFLDRATDPAVIVAGLEDWSLKLCRSLLGYLEDLKEATKWGPEVRAVWCEPPMPDPTFPEDPMFPEPPADPGPQRPVRRVTEDVAAAVEHHLAGDAITLTLLSAFKVRHQGLMETDANRTIVSFVNERRSAQGGKLKVAELMSLELYEVSRLFNASGLTQVAQPAIYLDLRALGAPATGVRGVFSEGYDPAAWLP